MCDHIWIMIPLNGTWKRQCYKCGHITDDITSARNWNKESSSCDKCPNNPKNGGTGICNCTIGLPKVRC